MTGCFVSAVTDEVVAEQELSVVLSSHLVADLAATAPHLASLYAASGITGRHGGTPCGTAASHFLSRLADTSPYPIVYLFGIGLVLVAPAIIGMVWVKCSPLVTSQYFGDGCAGGRCAGKPRRPIPEKGNPRAAPVPGTRMPARPAKASGD